MAGVANIEILDSQEHFRPEGRWPQEIGKCRGLIQHIPQGFHSEVPLSLMHRFRFRTYNAPSASKSCLSTTADAIRVLSIPGISTRRIEPKLLGCARKQRQDQGLPFRTTGQ